MDNRIIKMMKRRRRAAMTLVEIMIVIVIMGLIAGGVAVAVLPRLKKARIDDTKTGAQQIRSAVTLWVADNPSECPSVDQLVEDAFLDKGKRTEDAWGKAFRIECSSDGTEIMINSPGPDGDPGTEDDISVGG